MSVAARENSNTFRDAYLLAKADALRKQPRSVTPPRRPSYDKHPENWFTGTWADVEEAAVANPRSPRSKKWASMEADMASHCEDDTSSPVLARSLPTSPPSAASSPEKAGVESAISALRPWMQTMRGRALGAFAFPAERVWLRAIISAWRRLALSGLEARSSARGGQDRLAESLADALEVLRSFVTSPSTTAVGLVLRLRRLHNEVGEMWTEHLKSEAASQEHDNESNSRATSSSVGTDESSVSFFHRCLQELVNQHSKASGAKALARGRGRSFQSLGAAELADLKTAIAFEVCFRRFRGALSFAAAVWGGAYDRTEDLVFQAAVKRVLSVLFTLDAITHALPGKLEKEQDAFRIQEFSILEEVPRPLLEALQQLGPL